VNKVAVADKSTTGEKAYDLEVILGIVLRAWVAVSVAIMLLGLGLLAFKPGLTEVAFLTVAQIFSQAIKLQPVALLNLGVLVLLATPFMGVLVATVVFIMKKERIFVIISLAVLATLLVSLAVGSA
jgi:uncharacterized membrane protein